MANDMTKMQYVTLKSTAEQFIEDCFDDIKENPVKTSSLLDYNIILCHYMAT